MYYVKLTCIDNIWDYKKQTYEAGRREILGNLDGQGFYHYKGIRRVLELLQNKKITNIYKNYKGLRYEIYKVCSWLDYVDNKKPEKIIYVMEEL